jgi:hypothetical protein
MLKVQSFLNSHYTHSTGKGTVWSTEKQMLIINSLFYNFYIPPIMFAVVKDEDGHEMRICMDGKRRLTSIVRFLTGSVCFQLPYGSNLAN